MQVIFNFVYSKISNLFSLSKIFSFKNLHLENGSTVLSKKIKIVNLKFKFKEMFYIPYECY